MWSSRTTSSPSGLRQPTTIGIIGNGMLVNAQRLADELQALSPVMADLSDRVFVSDRAHLILPLHRVVDATQEDAKVLTGRAVGTTRRGIGPANVAGSASHGSITGSAC
jgi:adenylosuccinate synthase